MVNITCCTCKSDFQRVESVSAIFCNTESDKMMWIRRSAEPTQLHSAQCFKMYILPENEVAGSLRKSGPNFR